jgi:hypothetical protein
MSKRIQIVLIILLIPALLVGFTVVHELGHTILARALGDPDSTFYLVKIDEGGTCLGCNIYDHTRISKGGNLLVSLGGLLATQLAALGTLFGYTKAPQGTFVERLSIVIAVGFAFLDVPVQTIQGLVYDLNSQTWPTNVDPVDAMLLISDWSGAGQVTLKIGMLLISIAYLYAFVRVYRSLREEKAVE